MFIVQPLWRPSTPHVLLIHLDEINSKTKNLLRSPFLKCVNLPYAQISQSSIRPLLRTHYGELQNACTEAQSEKGHTGSA